MFDIFGKKKRDELLSYIDAELCAVKKRVSMNTDEFRKVSGNNPEDFILREAILKDNRETMVIMEELTRIRKAIERIYG